MSKALYNNYACLLYFQLLKLTLNITCTTKPNETKGNKATQRNMKWNEQSKAKRSEAKGSKAKWNKVKGNEMTWNKTKRNEIACACFIKQHISWKEPINYWMSINDQPPFSIWQNKVSSMVKLPRGDRPLSDSLFCFISRNTISPCTPIAFVFIKLRFCWKKQHSRLKFCRVMCGKCTADYNFCVMVHHLWTGAIHLFLCG